MLIAELRGREQGRALDVGCGEGADAIWLASQGGPSPAPTFQRCDRARRNGGPGGWRSVEWICADVGRDATPPRG